MLRTKHRLNIRNRRLLRNKKSFKRNELIKVSRSNQKEWSEGVTQWFTRRQIKRINNKYPERKHIISAAIKAHIDKNYYLSIPTLFAQIDGICKKELKYD